MQFVVGNYSIPNNEREDTPHDTEIEDRLHWFRSSKFRHVCVLLNVSPPSSFFLSCGAVG